MSFIIDPTSINHSSIRADIEAWLASKPDAEQWAVFFQSSAGQALIDLVSGMAAFFEYDAIVARREAYVPYAQNRSSIIGGAQFLGYSTFRGKNAVVKMTIIPATTGVWNKWDVLGVVKDRSLIISEDTAHNAGIPITVNCIVGELATESHLAPDANLNSFRFKTSGVSSDCRIFIDDVEVSWGEGVIDLLDNKFILQSNPLGSVDAKYLNLISASTRYNTNSVIRLDWINLKNIDFVLTDIVLDEIEGVLSAVEVLSYFDDVETASSIKVNAPLKNETKYAVRGRKDQAKIFRQLDPRIIDAIGEDISAAVVRIYYLLQGDLRLTPDEKVQFQNLFEPYRPFGWLPPVIADADRAQIALKLTIYLNTKASGNINTIVDSVLSSRQNVLGQTLSTLDIESELESNSYVRIARAEFTGPTWLANNKYELGQMAKLLVDNGRIYQVYRILYFSGNAEPTWSTLTDDGQVVWKAIPKSDVAGINDWVANHNYVIGNQVKPSVANGFIYEVVSYISKSGSVEPTWPALAGQLPSTKTGTKIIDGDIVWIARPLEGTVLPWSPNTKYERGELVTAINPTSTDTVGLMFQVYCYVGKSGAVAPTFDTILGHITIDGNLAWKCLDPKAISLTLPDNQYFEITPETTVY